MEDRRNDNLIAFATSAPRQGFPNDLAGIDGRALLTPIVTEQCIIPADYLTSRSWMSCNTFPYFFAGEGHISPLLDTFSIKEPPIR